jgi:hypothetical protein
MVLVGYLFYEYNANGTNFYIGFPNNLQHIVRENLISLLTLQHISLRLFFQTSTFTAANNL